jgi:hypothetical protein
MIDRDMLREFEDALERACDDLAEKIDDADDAFRDFWWAVSRELDKLKKAMTQ